MRYFSYDVVSYTRYFSYDVVSYMRYFSYDVVSYMRCFSYDVVSYMRYFSCSMKNQMKYFSYDVVSWMLIGATLNIYFSTGDHIMTYYHCIYIMHWYKDNCSYRTDIKAMLDVFNLSDTWRKLHSNSRRHTWHARGLSSHQIICLFLNTFQSTLSVKSTCTRIIVFCD